MTSQSEMRHIPEETLEQYCLGRLSESETEPVEEHLLLCNLCQDTLTETEQFVTAVRSALNQLESQPATEMWWTRLWRSLTTLPKPVFALAACALALIVIIPSQTRNPAVVQLQAMRGAEAATQAPANTKLTLQLPAPTAATLEQGRLELRVANVDGAVVAQAPVQQKDGQIIAEIDGLSAGAYWARLYSNDQIVAEYGLNVR
jgi:anti-sigma factor RsiW